MSNAGSFPRRRDVPTAPPLVFGHIGDWSRADEPGEVRSVSVELDTGGRGGSTVIFVKVPTRPRPGVDFRRDDQVRLALDEATQLELFQPDVGDGGVFGTRPTGVLPFS